VFAISGVSCAELCSTQTSATIASGGHGLKASSTSRLYHSNHPKYVCRRISCSDDFNLTQPVFFKFVSAVSCPPFKEGLRRRSPESSKIIVCEKVAADDVVLVLVVQGRRSI